MTAIIVALGGKATATQRGSSLKSFIRTGCRLVVSTINCNNLTFNESICCTVMYVFGCLLEVVTIERL